MTFQVVVEIKIKQFSVWYKIIFEIGCDTTKW